ncbi:MAG: hypothetical protein N3C63_01470 [Rhodocyclaceae bacterium]|nr:hypothetical protein [Rhodocyclaceae bacterium]
MLQALWHRWRQSTTPSSPSGPDPVSEFLLQLRVAKEVTEILSPWQALMQTHPEGFTAAIEAAEEAGWPEHERLRLRAFGHFYRGELDEAFALAKDTALTFDNNRFDVDSFMLVIACLFHRGQGDDALRVLREIEAVHREPLHAQAVFWQSLAAIQIWRGALHEAWQALLQARTLAPQDIELLMTAYSLGGFKVEVQRIDESVVRS